eukprot:3744176-Amphidinium_carterae.1
MRTTDLRMPSPMPSKVSSRNEVGGTQRSNNLRPKLKAFNTTSASSATLMQEVKPAFFTDEQKVVCDELEDKPIAEPKAVCDERHASR